MSSDFGLYGVPADLQPYVKAAEQQYQDDNKGLAQSEKDLGTPDKDFCSDTDDSSSSSNNVTVDTPQAASVPDSQS